MWAVAPAAGAWALRRLAVVPRHVPWNVSQSGAASCSTAPAAQAQLLEEEGKHIHHRARLLLNRYSRGRTRDAVKLAYVLGDMELMGVHMDSLDFRRAAMLFCNDDMLPQLDALYRYMQQRAILPDLPTTRALLEGYCRHGHSERILELLKYVDSLPLGMHSMEHLFTLSKVLLGRWALGQMADSFRLLAQLREAGAPVADVLHSALVEVAGRNFKPHRRAPVLAALTAHLLEDPSARAGELEVLYDFACDHFEADTLTTLLHSDEVVASLPPPALEAGVLRIAKGLTLPGRGGDAAGHARLAQLLEVLEASGQELASGTAEEVMWAAHAGGDAAAAARWAAALAARGAAVVQWQLLPELGGAIAGAGAAGGAQAALELTAALAPPARAELVASQLASRLAAAEGAPPPPPERAALSALLAARDSDSDSEGELEDMLFSDEEAGER